MQEKEVNLRLFCPLVLFPCGAVGGSPDQFSIVRGAGQEKDLGGLGFEPWPANHTGVCEPLVPVLAWLSFTWECFLLRWTALALDPVLAHMLLRALSA